VEKRKESEGKRPVEGYVTGLLALENERTKASRLTRDHHTWLGEEKTGNGLLID